MKKIGDVKKNCWPKNILVSFVLFIVGILITYKRSGGFIFEYAISLEAYIFIFFICSFILLCSHKINGNESSLVLIMILPFVEQIFYSISPIFTYDTAHYLHYLPILNGEESFANWDIVRGPVFPFILNIVTKIGGMNNFSILTFEFIMFVVMMFFSFRVLEISEVITSSKFYTVSYILSLIFLFNPIILGSYHTLLTEMVASTVVIFCVFISVKWLDSNKKRSNVFFLFAMVSIACIMWQLKQPYFGCSVYCLIACLIILLIKRKTHGIKKTVFSVAILVSCCVLMIVSTIIWNSFVSSYGKIDEGRASKGIAASSLIGGLPLQYAGEFKSQDVKDQFELSERQKKFLDNKEEKLVDVYRLNTVKDGLSDRAILQKHGNGMSYSMQLWIKCFVEFTQETCFNYFLRFLKITNVLAPNNNQPTLHFCGFGGDENGIIYYRIFYGNDNVFYVAPYLEKFVNMFHESYDTPRILSLTMQLLAHVVVDSSFTLLMLLSPVLWLYYLIVCMHNNGKYERIQFIILTYCICNLALNVLLAAPIDRYLFTNYVLLLFSSVLFVEKKVNKNININNNLPCI